MKNHQRPVRIPAALLLATVTLLTSAGQVVAHGEVAEGTPRDALLAYQSIDLDAMRADIALGNSVTLLLGNQGLQLLDLQEFDVFLPGPKKIVFIDEDQNVIGEQPFDYWSFRGSVVGDPTSSAFISMDDRGIYGFVNAFGSRYNFLPADEEHVLTAGEAALVRVKWTSPVEQSLPSMPTLSTAQGSTQTMSVSSYQTATISSYADTRYRNAHSNYATRIGNACSAQYQMWQYVSIGFVCNYPFASANYSDSGSCTTQLNAFTAAHSRSDLTIDAWQLFTGKDINCQGIANTYPDNPGLILARNIRDSVIEAVDHAWWDTYDPDEVSDLGLASGHEITHLWGEPDHPSARDSLKCSNGSLCYNIMALVDPDDQGFWHTGNTQSRVMTAVNGQF